jgi:Bacterial type II/III secretion system short domain
MKQVSGILAATLALVLGGSLGWAQTASPAAKPASEAAAAKPDSEASAAKPATSTAQMRCANESAGAERTFYLNNAVQQADANEIVTALRNFLDACNKVYLVASQNAIVVRASPENMALTQKLLNELDRPKKSYRLTYTITEMDGTRRISSQQFAMIVASGQKTTLKQNSRVPAATGSYSAGGSVQTQFTYIDVGINFDATLDEFANGARLRTLIDQSAVVPQEKDAAVQQPVIRHATLEGASFLAPGKPLMLGSLDIPGSTRRLDVEVVMAQLP